ncbi:MAG: anti-sigma factor antagonist [Firmicutes bacterium]|nr:anti-sigma factor antagonist [Bacillota bacterium]
MKIVFKTVNSILYVGISGELDESMARQARESLDAMIDEADMKKVVFDMSELSFMDSTGIGVILGRFKKLKALGIPLLIANPTKAVDKILNLSGVYQHMPKVMF